MFFFSGPLLTFRSSSPSLAKRARRVEVQGRQEEDEVLDALDVSAVVFILAHVTGFARGAIVHQVSHLLLFLLKITWRSGSPKFYSDTSERKKVFFERRVTSKQLLSNWRVTSARARDRERERSLEREKSSERKGRWRWREGERENREERATVLII